MSKLKMTISIEFYQDGKDREPMYLNLDVHADNPTDENIADIIRDEIIEHLQSCQE
jgi:hypothetical protein